jgi:hypothetical protein
VRQKKIGRAVRFDGTNPPTEWTPIDGIAIQGNILDLESDDIATSQLAVDGQTRSAGTTAPIYPALNSSS